MRRARVVAAWAVVGSLLSLACETTGPLPEPEGTVAELTLPPINPYLFAAMVNPGCQDTGYGINDSGAVIGHSACLGIGAFVKRAGVITSLPRPAGLGTNGSIFPLEINLSGRVVGYSVPGDGTYNFRALQWTPSGSGHTVLDLGTLAGGGAAEARAINAAGDVVGWSEIAMAGGVIRKHGFLRRPNGTRIDLVPANGYLNAEANDVNASGFVVGKSYTPIQSGALFTRATVWKPASSGSNIYLPVLLSGNFAGSAEAVNTAGAIVGSISVAGVGTHLARWQVNGSAVEDLSPADSYTIGYDVNASGVIVGERTVGGARVAFAFGTKFTTLPVPASGRAFATGVNQCGTIVGEGHQNQAGSSSPVQVAAQWSHLYLLCPAVVP
ncbi:MAG: hypothetical protein IPI92_11135 [Gemmatimonadetes bacterium]|nr:hypothetical protein [Gemmatimonadota bacterium]MBK7785552.1 hypothetical protein [Gemmatimonadota bacterium]MBK9069325.1 hypothetical protein [Gemmatimonadota bacterium]